MSPGITVLPYEGLGMLNPPDGQFRSAAQTQTAAQAGNVVLDYACRHLETEGYFFISLCLADEKQNLRFPSREFDQHKRTAR
jgi:hypothetical protein